MKYTTTINKSQAMYRRSYAYIRNTVIGFFLGVIVAILVCSYTTNANSKENFENPLNIKYCNEVNGTFNGKFADCIYDNYVVEGEVLSSKSKIYEAIGQILYYGSKLQDKQMVIWVYKHPKTKEKLFNRYFKELCNTIKFHNLQIIVILK